MTYHTGQIIRFNTAKSYLFLRCNDNLATVPNKPCTFELFISFSSDVIVKLADTLAKYTTSNKKTPEEVLAEIPAGVDGYLPSAKLQATIKTIDPDFPTADLEQITSEFCKKGDDNVDILGLKKQLRPAISKKLQDMLMKRRENDEDLNALVIQSIILYLRKNHLTLYDLYKKIDSNHDNLVTYQEFDSFLRGLEIALSSEQLSKLLSEFDKKKEENIRFDNFVDTLKPYMIERPEAPSTVDEVLLYVAAYIKENNISTTELFSSLDMNQDGFVSRKELGEVLFKVNVPNDEAKIKEIFDHFDRNHDNRVSIKEFVDIVKPYLEKAEVFASIPHSKVHSNEATPKDLADVKKKLAGVLNSEYHTLEKVFPIFSQGRFRIHHRGELHQGLEGSKTRIHQGRSRSYPRPFSGA